MNRSAVWRLRDVYWGGWNCCSSCPCHPAPLSSQGSTDLEPPAGVRSIPFILFVPVRLCLSLKMGFPGGSAGKESTCSAGDLVWSLGWETTWRREWLPTPVFWPGEFQGLYSPCSCKELGTTEWVSHSLRKTCQSGIFKLVVWFCLNHIISLFQFSLAMKQKYGFLF